MQSGFSKFSRFGLMLALVATMLLMVGTLSAQTTKGTISGTVTDSVGAVVVGAKVVATESSTGETRTVNSNSTGGFRIEAVNPGTYMIEVSAPTFSKAKLANVVVAQSVVTPVNVKLKA